MSLEFDVVSRHPSGRWSTVRLRGDAAGITLPRIGVFTPVLQPPCPKATRPGTRRSTA